ncbi:MAG: hypothetical protein Q7T73_16850 [Beijerinckiaceae bacterium]|nr:hypothetical protein [Beijerinckiaceae bacterium]
MTTAKEKVAGRVLMADVCQWLRGEYPQPVHLVTAPTLEEWGVVWIPNLDGLGTEMRLQGIISGSPTKDDGDEVRTSPVILLDRNFAWARTSNSIYRLGRQAGVEIPIEGVWT